MRKSNFAPGHVDEFEPLTEGEESQAFVFEGDGEGLVVLINQKRTGFAQDAAKDGNADFVYWASNRCGTLTSLR